MKQKHFLCEVFIGCLVVGLTLTGCVVQAPQETEMSQTLSAYYPDWMAQASFAPTFDVLDTESSLGPYAEGTKAVGLKDLIKMHGHPCDGLVTAACALRVGLSHLYPNGPIDRTDTACVTNNSPCYPSGTQRRHYQQKYTSKNKHNQELGDSAMTKLQILGTGCPKCKKLAELTETAATELGLTYELEKVTDINAIMKMGVMMTPALAVDGQVKIAGKVPSAEEIRLLLQ